MVFTTSLKNKVTNLMQRSFVYGEIGTGEDNPTVADSELVSPVATTRRAVAVSNTDDTVVVRYVRGSDDPTATLTEFGVEDANGTMMFRLTHADIVTTQNDNQRVIYNFKTFVV